MLRLWLLSGALGCHAAAQRTLAAAPAAVSAAARISCDGVSHYSVRIPLTGQRLGADSTFRANVRVSPAAWREGLRLVFDLGDACGLTDASEPKGGEVVSVEGGRATLRLLPTREESGVVSVKLSACTGAASVVPAVTCQPPGTPRPPPSPGPPPPPPPPVSENLCSLVDGYAATAATPSRATSGGARAPPSRSPLAEAASLLPFGFELGVGHWVEGALITLDYDDGGGCQLASVSPPYGATVWRKGEGAVTLRLGQMSDAVVRALPPLHKGSPRVQRLSVSAPALDCYSPVWTARVP